MARQRHGNLVLACATAGLLLVQLGRHAYSEAALARGDLERALAAAPRSSLLLAESAHGLVLVDNVGAATPLARAAIARAPLSPEALGDLAYAARVKDDVRSADALVGTASRLGRRDPYIQLELARLALQRGDADAAAGAIDALLRQNYEMGHLFALLREIGGSEAGAIAVAARLAAGPLWRPSFLSVPDPPEDFPSLERILTALASTSAPATAEELAHIATRLHNRGDDKRGRAIWLRTVPRAAARGELLLDGGFAGYAATSRRGVRSPYEWSLPASSGAFVDIGEPPQAIDGPALHVRENDSAMGPVARQALVLPPGTYRLSGSWLATAAGMKSPLRWKLRCPSKGGKDNKVSDFVTAIAGSGWQTLASPLTITSDCTTPRLELWIFKQSAGPAELWVDNLRLEKA